MLNKSMLMGRLTKDPELRRTDSGKAVLSFTVATDNGYGDNKKTYFINCVAWGNSAEFIERNFEKGQMIVIEGRLTTRTWEGQDGKKNYVTEVLVCEAHFGGSKKTTETVTDEPTPIDEIPDDLPWAN